MKKSVLFISSIFLFISFSKPVEKVSFMGYVTRCGNDPFVYPVLTSENGNVYGLVASEEELNKLLQYGGEKITVSGTFFRTKKNASSLNGGKNGSIQLDSWSVIE